MTDVVKSGSAFLAAALVSLTLVAGSAPAKTGSAPVFVNGKLNYPPSIRAKIGSLNATLDSCLIGNGAQRVALGRGWTYDDPGLRASKACSGEQDAVNTFANSQEMREANEALAPALNAYWTCMEGHGIEKFYPVTAPAPRSAINAASSSCGAPSSGVAGG